MSTVALPVSESSSQQAFPLGQEPGILCQSPAHPLQLEHVPEHGGDVSVDTVPVSTALGSQHHAAFGQRPMTTDPSWHSLFNDMHESQQSGTVSESTVPLPVSAVADPVSTVALPEPEPVSEADPAVSETVSSVSSWVASVSFSETVSVADSSGSSENALVGSEHPAINTSAQKILRMIATSFHGLSDRLILAVKSPNCFGNCDP